MAATGRKNPLTEIEVEIMVMIYKPSKVFD